MIVINGRETKIDGETLTYERAVDLAPVDPKAKVRVVYSNARAARSDGALVPGQSVRVRKGTRVNVIVTAGAA